MKRFFCTVCVKERRVRRLPEKLQGAPGELVGECRYHKYQPGMSHKAFNRKALPPRTAVLRTVKAKPVAQPAPAKGKRKAS